MVNYIEIARIIVLIYLPISVLLLLYGAWKKYPNYKITTHWISSLGEKSSSSSPFFNALVFGLFLTGPFLVIQLLSLKISQPLLLVFLICTIIIAISLIGVLLNPSDARLKNHLRWAGILLFGLVVFLIIIFLHFAYNPNQNLLLSLLAFVNLLILITYFLSNTKYFKKYNHRIVHNLTQLDKNESSWLIKKTTVLEWASVIGIILLLWVLIFVAL